MHEGESDGARGRAQDFCFARSDRRLTLNSAAAASVSTVKE
jgi:hypothetical protein